MWQLTKFFNIYCYLEKKIQKFPVLPNTPSQNYQTRIPRGTLSKLPEKSSYPTNSFKITRQKFSCYPTHPFVLPDTKTVRVPRHTPLCYPIKRPLVLPATPHCITQYKDPSCYPTHPFVLLNTKTPCVARHTPLCCPMRRPLCVTWYTLFQNYLTKHFCVT